jgi:hypothetical protein
MGGEILMKKTVETKQIEAAVGQKFPNVEAYRYNSASIRVRVIDDSFKNMSKSDREKIVQPLLDPLPEKIQGDIMILLLLAPHEAPASLMNLEFEHPTPSKL